MIDYCEAASLLFESTLMLTMSNTVVVTGGAGFIGSNFILQYLMVESAAIVNVDKLTYAGSLINLAPLQGNSRYRFLCGDICDRELIKQIFSEHPPTAVVHFAAESHVDRSIRGPEQFIRTNVQGTFTLLEEAREYLARLDPQQRDRLRFLHVSTDEVYGSLGEGDSPFTEDSPYAPNSPYAASKASADHLARAYFHTYGLPVVTSNCSNNYGPFQFPEKLIPLVINNALRGDALPVYGDGRNIRDWIFVEDHCNALRSILMAGVPGETYNVGGRSERRNMDVVRAVCAALDEFHSDSKFVPHENLIRFVKDRPGHDYRYAIDPSKIERELGWKSNETFETGIRKTVAWYLSNGGWIEHITSGAYRGWIREQYG